MTASDPEKPQQGLTPTNAELMELPPPTEDVVVLARNPAEVQAAQSQLLAWAESKVKSEEAELREAEANLEQSKRLKIRTQAWKLQVTKAQNRVTYYEKVRDAIKAGYYIVPNFPTHLLAIRTTKKRPPPGPRYSERGVPEHPDVRSELPPSGEGRYVSPVPATTSWRSDDGFGSRTTGFKDFDFPFRMVKPKILSDLADAMKLGIFDEIGLLPGGPVPNPGVLPKAPTLTDGDPMLLGIVKCREGSRVSQVTFLISWWIDTRTL